MAGGGLIWLWQKIAGPSAGGFAGPSLVVKRRPLVHRKKMMRAILMARR